MILTITIELLHLPIERGEMLLGSVMGHALHAARIIDPEGASPVVKVSLSPDAPPPPCPTVSATVPEGMRSIPHLGLIR